MAASLLKSRKITEYDLSITFVGDKRIRKINREYLNHDYVTDVISFDLGDGIAGRDAVFGDIYICATQAVRQARPLGIDSREELLRLVVHGILHLLGYDHTGPADREEMLTLQESTVERFLKSK
jgi:probable rRNA maturation factor